MKRLTLAWTTWGSNAQPEKRTTVWARAARGAAAVARPSAPAATKRRREIARDMVDSFRGGVLPLPRPGRAPGRVAPGKQKRETTAGAQRGEAPAPLAVAQAC